MKKLICSIFFLVNAFLIFSQSLDDVKLKLKSFFNQIITEDATMNMVTGRYGKPDSVVNKKTGYLDDEMITYSYENIGNFNFFYNTSEKKYYFLSVNLNSNYINKINFPTTMDAVDNFFNTKFNRRVSQLNPGNIYLGYYNEEFTVNFIFKEEDCKLYRISWILH